MRRAASEAEHMSAPDDALHPERRFFLLPKGRPHMLHLSLGPDTRLGIWMNGWAGLFLAVRRMGCLRAGCEFGTEPAHAPQPRPRPQPCDRDRRDPSRRGPAARPPAPAPERVPPPRRCPRALACALPPP